ncbi:phage portal protein [Micromonospora costi]|uniref:phage portal protein n=1 Tax=Micromonospora costi TaxID=1530042 RepID=UPI003405C9FC
MAWFRRESRAAQTVTLADMGAMGANTHAGIPVTDESALRLNVVYSCVDLIASGVASLPLDVYRDADGRKVAANPPAWVKSPNPYMTPFTFWHQVVSSLLLDGNAFIWKVRNDRGTVVALLPVDPARVAVDWSEDGTGVVYRLDGKPYGVDDLVHVPAFTRPGALRGLSPVEQARQSIGLGLVAEEFGARFFSQGTTLSGVIEHPGMPKPGEVEVMQQGFKKRNQGVKSAHGVAIITGGGSWKSISITPEQAQFLETRRFQNLQIAQLYRVPPHLVDPTVQSSWGSGVEEQNKFFLDYTLLPWIVRLEQAFSALLPNRQYIRFNVDARLRAKTTERYSAYRTAITSGFMSRDEVRALEDLEPIPGGAGATFIDPASPGKEGDNGNAGNPIDGPAVDG